jgi:hypothetical protein
MSLPNISSSQQNFASAVGSLVILIRIALEVIQAVLNNLALGRGCYHQDVVFHLRWDQVVLVVAEVYRIWRSVAVVIGGRISWQTSWWIKGVRREVEPKQAGLRR